MQCLDEIMNSEIKNELKIIRGAPGLSELQLAVWNSTFVGIAGFRNINSFDDCKKTDYALQWKKLGQYFSKMK